MPGLILKQLVLAVLFGDCFSTNSPDSSFLLSFRESVRATVTKL